MTISNALSSNEIDDFYSLIGRKVEGLPLNPTEVRIFLAEHKADEKQASFYRKHVWSKFDVHAYISEHAKECASFAASIALGDQKRNFDRTYELSNPQGDMHTALGWVEFRSTPDFSLFFTNDKADVDFSRSVTIENIGLHPSIRNFGFLKNLGTNLALHGMTLLILQKVINPSFAYHLFQNSMKVNSNILILSGLGSADFDKYISPGPSFGMQLTNSSSAFNPTDKPLRNEEFEKVSGKIIAGMKYDQLKRIALVTVEADRVFGNPVTARFWLLQENSELGAIPFSLLKDEEGTAQVLKTLAAISHGNVM